MESNTEIKIMSVTQKDAAFFCCEYKEDKEQGRDS